MNTDYQRQFLYLFERIGEPLSFGPRGSENNLTFFNIPLQTCKETQHASTILKQGFANVRFTEVQVERPSTLPNLNSIGRACPKSSLYSYFNPSHRQAVMELRKIFLDQRDLKNLMSMACTCRDNEMINPKVWITAFASCLINRPDTRGFRMPALWEVMPDMFFSPFCLKEAVRQGSIPQQDRAIIEVNTNFTGRDTNVENRLAYFREDLGLNSHHWHWHLIYTLEDPRGRRDRKGELFYWFHHEMMARYDAERLGNGMARVRPLLPDDPILKEGYFPKLTDSTSGRVWGTRQQDTRLTDINREDDTTLPPGSRTLSLETFRRYRDRIMEAIDKGTYLAENGQRVALNIDILGDIVESTTLSPNRQYYGELGLHNIGHLLIALAHDPEYKHRENMGVLGDNVGAMRDPAFYRWHKYVDDLFDLYKQTLQPYNPTGGDLQLVWDGIQISGIQIQTESPRQGVAAPAINILRTFRMQSHVDMSRGLDFLRWGQNLGPIFARTIHLNHDAFNYTINVQNTGTARSATVRIYLAPRQNEHRERFPMVQQRLLFFELDRFTTQLNPGANTITRRSTQSTVTIPWDQTFQQLERSVESPTAEQSFCGCGWPQHMLIPRGTAVGQLYDLVVFLTNGEDDRVVNTQPPTPTQTRSKCREAMSYCGVLDQLYPDRKPMGYPFDRNPYTTVNANDPNGPQIPVPTLEEYVSRIPNMRTIQIRIVYDAERIDVRNDVVPTGNRVVSGDPMTPVRGDSCGNLSRGSSPPPTNNNGRTTMPTGAASTPVPTSVPRPAGTTPNGGKTSRPGIPPNRKPKVTTTVVSSTSRPSSPGGSSTGSSGSGGNGWWGSRESSPRRGPWGWGK